MNKGIHHCAAAAVLLTAMTAAGAASYTAILTGPQEAPPNGSPGIGAAVVKFDPGSHVLEINVAFSGLLTDTTVAHIHCCTAVADTGTAGVATQVPTFGGFPAGVTHGAYSNIFDTSLPSSWNPTFLSTYGGSTAFAEAAFENGLKGGLAYLNIHSTAYPSGEIRGFLTPVAAVVPEPEGYALLGLGLPAILL